MSAAETATNVHPEAHLGIQKFTHVLSDAARPHNRP